MTEIDTPAETNSEVVQEAAPLSCEAQGGENKPRNKKNELWLFHCFTNEDSESDVSLCIRINREMLFLYTKQDHG